MAGSLATASYGRLASTLAAAIAIILCAAGVAAPAHAQYYEGPAYSFPVTDMIGPAIAGTSMASYIDRNRGSRPTEKPSSSDAGRRAKAVDLRISSSPAISQKVKADFRAQLIRSNPDRRAAIDQALARDWLAGYRSEIARPNKLDPRNLADAVTAYMVAAWAIVHKQEQLSSPGIASVRDHFRNAMAESPQTARLSAAARQEMAETLIYQTVLIMANRTQIARTKDRKLADAASRHYRSAVRTGANIDLHNLRLEGRGFVAD